MEAESGKLTRENMGQPASSKEEHVVSELAEAKTGLAPNNQVDDILYAGDAELEIEGPLDLKMLSRVYNHLQTLREVKILYTRGSIEQGIIIAVAIENAIPLIRLLSSLNGLKATPKEPEDASAQRKWELLPAKRQGKIKRISLVGI